MDRSPRLMREQGYTVLNGADQPFMPANDKCVRLIISAPQVGAITLSFNGPAVLYQGITVYAGQAPLYLEGNHVGEAIVEEIRAISSVPGQVIGWIQMFTCDQIEPRSAWDKVW